MDADREVDLTLQKSNWKVLYRVKNGRKEKQILKKKGRNFILLEVFQNILVSLWQNASKGKDQHSMVWCSSIRLFVEKNVSA